MKAVISSTYDHQYLFFIPLCAWAWNHLGVDVVCFLPYSDYLGREADNQTRAQLIRDTITNRNLSCELHYFNCPDNKKATYAQCSRLYAAALDLPEDEVLITGDCDMAVFNTGFIAKSESDFFDIYGADLVPNGQLPICYAVGIVKTWRRFFIKGRSYQECLDHELSELEAEHFRGNFWSRDQELLANGVGELFFAHNRARPGTQFASNRYDRDDAYLLDRLSPDTIDYHMPRPGYEENNFNQILTVLKYHYPDEDFTWLENYRREYLKLL